MRKEPWKYASGRAAERIGRPPRISLVYLPWIKVSNQKHIVVSGQTHCYEFWQRLGVWGRFLPPLPRPSQFFKPQWSVVMQTRLLLPGKGDKQQALLR